ncbi:hypothetical protein GPL21_25095 [Bradyrhizobium pachyrhizi]|uniref:Carboxypeptidase regulatory-like domain-containing protein n=1 Tax=Bradyrhizobium pachyrhizi TaxID=280333 RepID=A0A844SQI5_9BRAD|nr:carboxypeptidase-like regulatory domain-containing protein [Bradyrhizobium pachyrhizi]MVT68377.1 hypothetical protein [Bradyrhizobium pachyrhizi]WFU57477.1 carboxypeptidase-like regulatory domain-containing protein [Bradyrhizobium pachyrhizi]
MRRMLAICLVLIAAGASSFAAQSLAADIRPLPYPFGSMITFSSDVDYQTPWQGHSIHRYLNEELGLPITDSFWISSSTGGDNVSALFKSYAGLSTQPSRVGEHSVFGLLLRQWHRGNIDTIHSWADDMLPQFRRVTTDPLPLSAGGISLDLKGAGQWTHAFEAFGGKDARGYQQLRMFFDRDPPNDLVVEAQFADDATYVFPRETTARFRMSAGKAPSAGPTSVTVILNEPRPIGVMPARDGPFPALTGLRIKSGSCGASCAVNLVAIERDNFSRWSVLAEKNMVDFLNIRPSSFTSHGGMSYHPSFEGPGPHYKPDYKLGADVRQESMGLAGAPGTHGYYADILKQMGFRSVTSIWNGDESETWSFQRGVAPLVSVYPGFYALAKTHVNFGEAGDPIDASKAVLVKLDPRLEDFDLEAYVCTVSVYCRSSSQGATAGGQIALGRHLIAKGASVQYHWYTHFGTVYMDPTFTATPEAPFPAVTMEEFRNLAGDYYNPSGELPEAKRVWVPPSAVWSNYRIVHSQIAEHVSVNPETSAVAISSFVDQVLQEKLPDPNSGTRDLHGITIYVPSSDRATVSLDGKPITSFTRNPADATGRESVTIVDDNTPTTFFNRLPLERSGETRVAGGTYNWQSSTGEGAEAPPGYARLTATSRETSLTFAPGDLKLFNVTHLSWSYRMRRDDGRAAKGRLSIVWRTAAGATVSIAEGVGSRPPDDADTGRWTKPFERDGKWHAVTVAQHDFLWKPGFDKWRVLPLALGKIRSVEIKLIDTEAGDILEIGAMQGLRPTGNAVAPDQSLLIAGQVVAPSGRPQQGVEIRLHNEDGSTRTTATDAGGYYILGKVKRDSLVSVSARAASGPCFPKRGAELELRQDEAELDFDLSACTKKQSLAIRQ